MTIAQTLGTQYFQLSTVAFGALASGVEDFRQRINNVLNTIPGTDPLRPFFGCNILNLIDLPSDQLVPSGKKEIYDAITSWIPEIELKAIDHTITDGSKVDYQLTYIITDSNITDTLNFTTGGISGINSAIIIKAAVPVPVTNGVYNIEFILDDQPASPVALPYGYDSADDILKWVNQNWFAYGRWFRTAGYLVLYLNGGVASKVSLIITQTVISIIKVLVPVLPIGSFYNLNFEINGSQVIPAFPVNSINTLENLLGWIDNNWADYGTWFIDTPKTTVGDGDFAQDFSSDFDNGLGDVINYLVFQANENINATLTFI